MWTIVVTIFIGAVIGALARLALPGRQRISTLVTVILGTLGSLIGSWVVYRLGYASSPEVFHLIPFLAGIVVAAALIALYGTLMGGRRV